MMKAPLTALSAFGLFAFGSLIWARPSVGQSDAPAAASYSTDVTSRDPQQQAKINAIMKRIHAGDWSAVDDVPAQFDRSVGANLLSDLLMSQDREDEPHRQAAGRALAKLGVEKDFSDLITRSTQVTSNSSNRKYLEGMQDRSRAFRALRYMHSARSVIALGAFLFDESPPPAEWSADVAESPNSVLAAAALASFGFTDAPTTETASFYAGGVEMWKKWWTAHKAQFEREQN